MDETTRLVLANSAVSKVRFMLLNLNTLAVEMGRSLAKRLPIARAGVQFLSAHNGILAKWLGDGVRGG